MKKDIHPSDYRLVVFKDMSNEYAFICPSCAETKEGQIIGQGMSEKQFQNEEFKEFLDPYSKGLPADVQTQLANRYAQLFEIFYKKRDKIDRVTMWGIHDDMSWKNDYPI
ncbi:MAG: hypothetical protein EAZ48_00400, partial [Flavobacteriia bacterium]